MPFNELPFEIIGRIFLTYWEMGEDPRTLLLVCHLWMHVAIQEHQIWTEFALRTNTGYFDVSSPPAIKCRTWNGIRSMAEYAGKLSIRLVLDFDRGHGGELWPPFSRELLAKCGVLELFALPGNAVTPKNLFFVSLHTLQAQVSYYRPNVNRLLLLKDIASSAPLLSKMYMERDTYGSLLSRVKSLIMEEGHSITPEFERQARKVEKLVLPSVCILYSSESFTFPNLTSLELNGSTGIPGIDCPALQELTIIAPSWDGSPFSAGSSFTLPSLRSLTLSGCRVIPPIYAPRLVSLRLHGGQDWAGSKLSSILPMESSLRHLSVREDLSEKVVMNLLSTKWTELEELEWGHDTTSSSFLSGAHLLAAIAGENSDPLCPNLRRLTVMQFHHGGLTKEQILDAMELARGIVEATLTERKKHHTRHLEYVKYGFDNAWQGKKRVWDYHYLR